MKVTKPVLLYIGIILAIAGILMELFNISFSGSYYAHKSGWISSIMTGKTIIFFGLVFIGARLVLPNR